MDLSEAFRSVSVVFNVRRYLAKSYYMLARHPILSKKWKMKDIGQAKYLLGIEDKTNCVIHLQQNKLIKEPLAAQGMVNAIPASTSMLSTRGDLAAPLQDDDLVDKTKYLHVIGKLNYHRRGTRLDVAYCVSKLARYIQ